MTEVAFHFNIPDRITYVSRLLRKALAKVDSVVVVAQPHDLHQLDAKIWALSPTDFLGHVRLDQQPDLVAKEAAKIWLTNDLEQCDRHQVLVSLLPQVPVGFQIFDRVIEIVGLEEVDRQQARLRWKHYAHQGYKIIKHDVQVRG